MNIAFDVDGVLWDIETFQLKYGKPYFARKNIPLSDPSGFGIREMFHCSEQEEKKFWILSIPKVFFAKAREHAREVVREMKKKGHRIFIITSRARTTDHSLAGAFMRKALKAWLKRNGIEYDEILFCQDDNENFSKKQACQSRAVDFIVEDRWENIQLLKKVTRVIGFRTRNNQAYTDSSIPFVHSFLEVQAELEKSIREIMAEMKPFFRE